MIARRWHGIVPARRSDEYLRLMQEVAIPDYRAVPGNRGAWCLRRLEGHVVHFEMLTYWDDLETIRGFAGDDVSKAKYYDFDAEFLIEKEATVLHFELHGAA